MLRSTRPPESAIPDEFLNVPSGEVRGRTKLIKITEDVRKYAAEQRLGEEEALQKCIADKSTEFLEKGVQVYAKA